MLREPFRVCRSKTECGSGNSRTAVGPSGAGGAEHHRHVGQFDSAADGSDEPRKTGAVSRSNSAIRNRPLHATESGVRGDHQALRF